MTILPKKKHQDPRKNDQEQDAETRNRNRSTRSSRDVRNRLQHSDDLSTVSEASTSSSSPIYNDLDAIERKKDIQETSGLPHKRSRHRQSSSFFSSPGNTNISRGSNREGSTGPNEDRGNDGYNSSDEHVPRSSGLKDATLETLNERESEFERQLQESKGFIIKQMATDGACLFRAVADQVYGDQEMHSVVRTHCMDYMVKNRDFFSQYVTEDFSSYIRRKRNEHAHGNHIEMQALSEMYNRPIEVYQYSYEPINTFHSRTYSCDDNAPIRVSYHGNVHYNSVTDPYNPTVGVGLGLAGYKPGVENQTILRKAMNESESTQLEQEMLEDKIKATDWEATDDQISELAARESYAQWLKDMQKTSSAGASSSTCSTSTQSRKSPPRDNIKKSPVDSTIARRSPLNDQTYARKSPLSEHSRKSPTRSSSNDAGGPLTKQSKGNSPQHNSPKEQLPRKSSPNAVSTYSGSQASSSNDWSCALGYGPDWDNDPVLAAVLAQSQQEYLDSLCKNNKNKREDS